MFYTLIFPPSNNKSSWDDFTEGPVSKSPFSLWLQRQRGKNGVAGSCTSKAIFLIVSWSPVCLRAGRQVCMPLLFFCSLECHRIGAWTAACLLSHRETPLGWRRLLFLVICVCAVPSHLPWDHRVLISALFLLWVSTHLSLQLQSRVLFIWAHPQWFWLC